MQLIEAMNRKQQKITLFIHYWMDRRGAKGGPTEANFPMELEEAEWEEQFLCWEQHVLTDELLEKHMAPPVPMEILEESS